MPLPLGRRLIAAGLVVPEEVEAALFLSVLRGVPFSRALLDRGAISEQALEEELDRQGDLALRQVVGDAYLMARLPRALCRRLGAVPMGVDPGTGTVDVAVADPLDPHVAAEIAFHLGAPIRALRAPITVIEEAIQRLELGEESLPSERIQRATLAFPHGAPESAGARPPELPIPLTRYADEAALLDGSSTYEDEEDGLPQRLPNLPPAPESDLAVTQPEPALALRRSRFIPTGSSPGAAPLQDPSASLDAGLLSSSGSFEDPDTDDMDTTLAREVSSLFVQDHEEPLTPRNAVSSRSREIPAHFSEADDGDYARQADLRPYTQASQILDRDYARQADLHSYAHALTPGDLEDEPPSVSFPTLPPDDDDEDVLLVKDEEILSIVDTPEPAIISERNPDSFLEPPSIAFELRRPRSLIPSPLTDLPVDTLPLPDLGPVLAALREAGTRDEAIVLALRGLGLVARRTAVLAVRKDSFQGWACNADFGDERALRLLSIPQDQPSIFATATATGMYLGPIPATQTHADLLQVMGLSSADVAIVAARVRGRPALILLADELGDTMLGTRRMEELARAVGEALTRLLGHR